MAEAFSQRMTAYQGADFKFQVTVQIDGAAPASFTSCGATMQLRSEEGDGTVLDTWSTGGGEITLSASGLVSIEITQADIDALEVAEYWYTLRLDDFDPVDGFDAGEKFALMSGAFIVGHTF